MYSSVKRDTYRNKKNKYIMPDKYIYIYIYMCVYYCLYFWIFCNCCNLGIVVGPFARVGPFINRMIAVICNHPKRPRLQITSTSPQGGRRSLQTVEAAAQGTPRPPSWIESSNPIESNWIVYHLLTTNGKNIIIIIINQMAPRWHQNKNKNKGSQKE